MRYKYYLGSLLVIPLLPILFYQGIKIRRRIPNLPEAQQPHGKISRNLKKPLSVIFIGESTIAGVGVRTHEDGFAGNFAKELSKKFDRSITWKVYAKSGSKAKDVYKNIIPKIDEKTADLVVIGLGGNDAFTLNNPKLWALAIKNIIAIIRKKFNNVPIVFTNMPPIKEFPAFTPLIKFTIGNLVELLGDELENLVQGQENVYYNAQRINLNDWLQRLNLTGKPSDFFSDGVHHSKFTYQIWAKDFVGFIYNNSEIQNQLK
jgi:lysophospholipase L1-like esterase